MDIKFERFTHLDPKLSAEEKEAVTQMLLKVSRGAEQQMLGDKRREMAEGFFSLLNPEQKQKLEVEISGLHSIRDEGRFRIQFVLLLFEAFYGGILFEREIQNPKQPTT